MNPVTFAKAECANYIPDGSCLNINLEADGSMSGGHSRDHCILRDKERCAYFEKCVMPLADITSDPRKHKEYQDAVRKYAKYISDKEDINVDAIRGKLNSGDECPDCGDPKPKGHHRCVICAKKHKRILTKDRVARLREERKSVCNAWA